MYECRKLYTFSITTRRMQQYLMIETEYRITEITKTVKDLADKEVCCWESWG